MQITTEKILQMLSKDKSQKNSLLEIFNNLNENQRFNAERRIWDLFDIMYEGRLEVNLQKAFNEIAEGKRKLDKNLQKEVKEQTDKEIEKEFFADTTSADLNSVRDKISKIIGGPIS